MQKNKTAGRGFCLGVSLAAIFLGLAGGRGPLNGQDFFDAAWQGRKDVLERALPGRTKVNSRTDIWLVRRTGEGWSDPVYVGTDMMYVTVNAEGTIYTTGPTQSKQDRADTALFFPKL